MLGAVKNRCVSSLLHPQLKLGFHRAHLISSLITDNNATTACATAGEDRKDILSLSEVETILKDVRADNVKVIPVQNQSFTDHVVLATGRSAWHVRNIAQALFYKAKIKQRGGEKKILPTVEGQKGGKWIVVDSAPDETYYFGNLVEERPMFRDRRDSNMHLNILTKRAALKGFPFSCCACEEEIIQGSGTVIDNYCNMSANLIRRPTHESVMENVLMDNLKIIVHLCDGKSYKRELCAYDFHYNLAAIGFQSETRVATVAHIDDSVSVSSSEMSSNLTPGDRVIDMGRYFVKPFKLMAAPGEYWLERSSYDCKELFMAKCAITRCGDGGPLINHSGEVIGSLVIHALDEKMRAYYNLDALWTEERSMKLTSEESQDENVESGLVKVRRKNNSKRRPVKSA